MFKRILCFVLVLCMCMSGIADINVFASEIEKNNEEKIVLIADDNMNGQEIAGGDETFIPQNGSVIHMESSEPQIMAYSLRKSVETMEERYTVLVLDTSTSMDFIYNGTTIYTADTALPHVKKASQKFINDIQNVSDNHYIAIVTYSGSTAKVVSPFTNDTNKLLTAINSLDSTSGPNVCSALTTAEELLDEVESENAIKNVVLFTTGMTNTGDFNYTGHYNASTVGSGWRNSASGINLYAYANAAYTVAEELKEKSTIYSIGLFSTWENMPENGRNIVQFFKLCACDWASSQEHFYDVKNPDELEFVFGQVAENIVSRTGTFSYPGDGEDYTSTYYYDDNYFNNTSYEYNQSLATMSLCLELSAWGSAEEDDYTKKTKNAEALFNEIGFVGFDHNYNEFAGKGIEGKPTRDSIGVVVANKKVSFDGTDYTLIAVAVRGGTYESEWASNFTIGEEGEHQGFAQARDTVIAFLEEYIKEQGISGNIKFWITGYSRGAATANMVAGAIDNGNIDLNGCSLELKDMFVYTFETPAGAMKAEVNDSKYNNIFNIINLNDLVPKVAPAYWGFGRYGVDKYKLIPEAEGTLAYLRAKTNMLAKYQELGGYEEYVVDDFVMKKIQIVSGFGIVDDTSNSKITQNTFLNSYVTMLSKELIKTRVTFVKMFQEEVRFGCGLFFSAEAEKQNKLIENVMDKFSKNYKYLIWKLILRTEADAYALVADYLKECLDEAEITEYSEKEFDAAVSSICNLILAAAVRHPNLTSTLVMNYKCIRQAHFPELCLAWMQSMDSNYTEDAEVRFSTGKYRIVRINCPVDVKVYDEAGTLLTSIINNEPQLDGALVAAFNEDDEKLVYLPVYNDYIVKLIPTATGTMNYAVQDYNPQAGETNHLINFYDIQIAEDQEYTAYIPAYSEEEIQDTTEVAAKTDYTLYMDGVQILPSVELSGEDAFNAYYDITATAEDVTKGIVFGSGIRQLGTFAKVTAEAYAGYEFVGWYVGENVVSTEKEYRFRVSEDVNLVAVFKEIAQTETPDEGTDETPDEGTGETPDEGTDETPDEGTGETPNEGTDETPDEGTGETPNEGTDETPDDGTDETPDDGTDETAGNTLEGAFRVVDRWDDGFTAEITLTNTTEDVIHDWTVKFDLPYEITNLWNGTIVAVGNGVYIVKNAVYNWDIKPGESVTFGFVAGMDVGDENIIEPTKYILAQTNTETITEGIEYTYTVNDAWDTAFIAQIEIKNVTSEDILDWTLEFDYENTINQFWEAEIAAHDEKHYVIKNKGYNAVIGAGQTLVLRFEANCDKVSSNKEPMNYVIIQ